MPVLTTTQNVKSNVSRNQAKAQQPKSPSQPANEKKGSRFLEILMSALSAWGA